MGAALTAEEKAELEGEEDTEEGATSSSLTSSSSSSSSSFDKPNIPNPIQNNEPSPQSIDVHIPVEESKDEPNSTDKESFPPRSPRDKVSKINLYLKRSSSTRMLKLIMYSCLKYLPHA